MLYRGILLHFPRPPFHKSAVLLGSATGIAALGYSLSSKSRSAQHTPAETQFHTSSVYPVPESWDGPIFSLRNNYPSLISDALKDPDPPWLSIDFKSEPFRYLMAVKDYCWEGNVVTDFVVQDNKIRDWFHAPWMHHGGDGREPLRGLTSERTIPPFELAKGQETALQTWAIAFVNRAGASVFGEIWVDPNRPQWTKPVDFPEGSCTFKILLSTASDAEVPTMVDSPGWLAPDSKVAPPSTGLRNSFASMVRLIQVDLAVRDNRSPIGWVFGTFLYNGALKHEEPWNRLTPVGLQWGSDPEVTHETFENGAVLKESWINSEALDVIRKLGGGRATLGLGKDGRTNNIADKFTSSCASCHSVAQNEDISSMTPPKPKVQAATGEKIPVSDSIAKKWFRNLARGQSFDEGPGILSADYNMQVAIGWKNYRTWYLMENKLQRKLPGEKVIPGILERTDPPSH